jgi:hypothetical protein
MMSTEERVRILREAKPNSWVAFSSDESKVLAYGETYLDAVKAAEKLGEKDPLMVKVPDNWSSRFHSLCVRYPYKAFPLSHTDPVTKLDYTWMPALTVFISHNGKRSAPLESIADTGAGHCVFDAGIADGLGIPLREGEQVAFAGIAREPRRWATCTGSRSP